MRLTLPIPSLVLLVGPSGAGKSTWAGRRFRDTEIVSSDRCRALVGDEEADQAANPHAFPVLYAVVRGRLAMGRMTVVDATNLTRAARSGLIRLARENHVEAVAVVFDLPLELCIARDAARPGRVVGEPIVSGHHLDLRRSLATILEEGFAQVVVLRSAGDADAVEVVRERLSVDRREELGPFDLIGDVHGCLSELLTLLAALGWSVDLEGGAWRASHPAGRKVVFVGDLVDRGPDSAGVLALAMDLVQQDVARCVVGNHDAKLLKRLEGRGVAVGHGLAETMTQIEARPEAFRERLAAFLGDLPPHLVLDGGRLIVAHAGLKEAMHGRISKSSRAFALYGETNGENDAYGLPVRLDWARDYKGKATVVHGHVPIVAAEWNHNTIDIDTGCCFGGRLTALRWPERELVSVPAEREHCPPQGRR